ncbi:CDP-glycerol glycerophosphotransferase family protein [uncultured Helicobacter sp.]|uniref:CDP-glycerol glycerophosphotransferase family protein n=1 Tax=uncultured Helicobacter sp. TaxID=175537 RepID=UPI00374EE055
MLRILVLLSLGYVPAFAYLDPGSGSLLLSSVVAIFASVVFFIKNIFYKLTSPRTLLSGGFSSRGGGNSKVKTHIVFYSEGKQYYHTFKPILDILDSIKHPYTYLTSGQDDPALSRKNLTYGVFTYIGEGNKAYIKLNTLKADICVLTTPGLDVLQLKRSKGVGHYCHIVHSLTPMTYRAFGLDYFDSVLVANEIQKDFVREVEEAHAVKKKYIGVVGSTYLDELSNLRDTALHNESSLDHKIHLFDKLSNISSHNKPVILVSPSWGKETILSKYGLRLLEPLAKAGFVLIVRPHPQSLIGEAESKNIKNIQENLAKYENVVWDIGTPNVYAFTKADMMISDFSSVIFDFVCLEGKPVLTLDFEFDTAGYDLSDIDMKKFYTFNALKRIGGKLQEENFSNLATIIAEILESTKTQEVKKCKEELWRYPHHAGFKATQELLKIERELLEHSLKAYMPQISRIRDLDSMLACLSSNDTKDKQ